MDVRINTYSFRVMETNLTHYLSSVISSVNLYIFRTYEVFVAHHQEVNTINTTIGTCCAF